MTKISKPNEEALNRLAARASETHTDAMIIVQNGEPLGEWDFGKVKHPIETMSMKKIYRLTSDWKTLHGEEN